MHFKIDWAGRIVRLEHNRIVYTPPSGRMSLPPNAELLIPNCGVSMVKATGVLRTDMPTEMLRLADYFEQVISRDIDDDIDHLHCDVCNSSVRDEGWCASFAKAFATRGAMKSWRKPWRIPCWLGM